MVVEVLEEEEGFRAIVQSNCTAPRKIRFGIGVRRSTIVFVVSELTHGGIVVGVVIVGPSELTLWVRTIVGRRSSRTWIRRGFRGKFLLWPSPARTTGFDSIQKTTELDGVADNAMDGRTFGNDMFGGATDVALTSRLGHEGTHASKDVVRKVFDKAHVRATGRCGRRGTTGARGRRRRRRGRRRESREPDGRGT